jgi:hypothetical protein
MDVLDEHDVVDPLSHRRRNPHHSTPPMVPTLFLIVAGRWVYVCVLQMVCVGVLGMFWLMCSSIDMFWYSAMCVLVCDQTMSDKWEGGCLPHCMVF